MGRRTRWISTSSALCVLAAAGCAHGTGTVVPAELGREQPSLNVSPTAASTAATEPATVSEPTSVSSPPDLSIVLDTAPSTDAPTSDSTPATGSRPAGPSFSAGLGTPVGAAPSVRTRGDTRRLLDEGLFVHLAWEPDPVDASVFTPLPEDVPIIEAYANAQLAYYRAALGLTRPDDPMLDRFLVDGSIRFAAAFAARATAGNTLQLGSGVVLRPYVLGDRRTATTAVVLDCYLHDEQEVPIGGAAVPGPLRTYGLVATMVLVDGTWKIDQTGTEAGVCL